MPAALAAVAEVVVLTVVTVVLVEITTAARVEPRTVIQQIRLLKWDLAVVQDA